jgi:thiamine phosphate synthase YjbQ (UPF0047 family)
MVGMHSELITVRTGRHPVVHDLTTTCERFLTGGDAGLAIIETGAGSDDDLLAAVEALLPSDDRWAHRHGSGGHGRDHVLPGIISPSVTIPVIGGRLQMGVWQSICLVDTNVDNPERNVRLSFVAG